MLTAIRTMSKNIFIVKERMAGYTKREAELNWECEHGTCKCL
jgi:hypothetical protein